MAPKVHKVTILLRSIVSIVALAESPIIAKYLAIKLFGRSHWTPYRLLNSGDFAEKVKDLRYLRGRDHYYIAFDVTAVFTSITPADAIHAIRNVLATDSTLKDRTVISWSAMWSFEPLSWQHLFLLWWIFFQQSHGCSMWSLVSPSFSTCTWKIWIHRLVNLSWDCTSKWFRYVKLMIRGL